MNTEIEAQKRRDPSQRGLPEGYDPHGLPVNVQHRAQLEAKAKAEMDKLGITLEAPEGMQIKVVEVYVCTDPQCKDYYGAAGMPDLTQSFSGPKVENRYDRLQKHGSREARSRADCPTCQQIKGERVPRVLVKALCFVPVEAPAEIALPA